MSDLEILPNQISYSAAATACTKGNWPAALLLLHSMPGRRPQADSSMFMYVHVTLRKFEISVGSPN